MNEQFTFLTELSSYLHKSPNGHYIKWFGSHIGLLESVFCIIADSLGDNPLQNYTKG